MLSGLCDKTGLTAGLVVHAFLFEIDCVVGLPRHATVDVEPAAHRCQFWIFSELKFGWESSQASARTAVLQVAAVRTSETACQSC